LRACIGKGFAEQEMLINLVLVLQRFHIEKANPDYILRMKSTLTTKPDDFKMKVRRRPGRSLMVGIPGGVTDTTVQRHRQHEGPKFSDAESKPVSVFFGGNTGTCESLAQSLAKSASDFNFQVDIQNLDTATRNLPTDRPCVIIAASYEGKPPGNAKKFVAWIEQLLVEGVKLPMGIQYAVFGVGNSDWASTFHRIPRLVDNTMAELGAEQIIEASFGNVKLDVVGPWEEWSEQLLMRLSGSTVASQASVGVVVCIENSEISMMPSGEGMTIGTVISSDELANTSAGAAKRHVEIRLPAASQYTSGDYLVIQGRNPEETVRRVMMRFGLGGQDVMSVKSSKKSFLPTHPVAVDQFLRNAVELAAPVTKRQLAMLACWATEGSKERKELEKRQGEMYQELLEKRYSIIDTLEEVPGLDLPFGVYVDLLQPLSPRPYSISSSPLKKENHIQDEKGHAIIASVTFDVFESPALSGHGTFRGVVSSSLAARKSGDLIPCFVRPTNVGFRLPSDSETPVIMLAAGTGIAPMRAFIQERAAMKCAGVKLGPAILFFGCRHPDKDYIYRAELLEWEKEGVVNVIPCFSRPTGEQMRQHVPDALWEHRERVWEMFNSGGKIYVCGSAARLGRSSAQMCKRIWRDKTGQSEFEADEWLDKIKDTRYVSDVY
jgi:cytochrome P450/NADPH-cytochrome P450 reductase